MAGMALRMKEGDMGRGEERRGRLTWVDVKYGKVRR